MSGHLYEISRQFGAFVAVDNQYSALIPREMAGELKVGRYGGGQGLSLFMRTESWI